MAFTDFTMGQAVQKICTKVGDTECKTYCTNTAVSGYDGRAKDAFWESVLDILSDMYKDKTSDEEVEGESASKTNIFSNEDIRGLIALDENISISTGELAYSGLTNKLYKIIDIFPNPDNSNSLAMILKKISMDYFKGIKGEDFVPDNTLYWYLADNKVVFYPKGDIDAENNKVSVFYIKEIDIASYNYSAGGDNLPLTDLFSMAFIFKAIKLASQIIEAEKEAI